jgi:Putative bacterial sensory transduction regulator
MPFEHAVHEDTHDRVREYLRELFDGVHEDAEDGHFYVTYGSTVLEVSVDPYGPEDAAVLISSYCVQGVHVEETLLRGLLETNHQLPFGAFSLVGDDIFFSHALFGSALDRPNLLGALAAVATLADDYDDRIAARFGGQTALDRIRDTGGRKRRRKKAEAVAT